MDLVGYLETLPQEAVAGLYTSPWTCQAVLRGLPPLAKLYALRMVYLESAALQSPISNSLVESWVKPEGLSKHRVALSRLKRLQILQSGLPRSGEATWSLQHDFKSHLREAISEQGCGTPLLLSNHCLNELNVSYKKSRGRSIEAEEVPADVLAAAPQRKALDAYAISQWEALQLYLVHSNDQPPKQAPHIGKVGWMDLDSLLTNARLLSFEGGRDITETGFRFLMMDTFHQLWLLLKQYTEAAAVRSSSVVQARHTQAFSFQEQPVIHPFVWTERAGAFSIIRRHATAEGARLAKVVSFLLQLGCQGVGQPLAMEDFDDLQRSVAADLAQLGLLLPFKVQGRVWLSPTRMSLALSGGQSVEAQKEIEDGFIVVETNYRVVAYTASPIKLAVLRLFVRCDVVLPNAFIGTITRESVTEALQIGIEHDQIVRYLSQHADPHVAFNVPVVPAIGTVSADSELASLALAAIDVVADQIRLWQADMRRVEQHKAYLYDDFESEQLFQMTTEHARLLGTWLWEDAGKRRLAASAEGHAQLRDFIKSNK